MSGMSEKDILDGIKKSVENETPDVWEKIQVSEKYKYDFRKQPLTSKMRRAYMPAAAVALCAVITIAGLKMNLFNFSNQGTELAVGKGGESPAIGIVAPGAAEDSVGRETAPAMPDIFKPFAQDADASEASKALKFDIVTPDWMPEGFTMVSSKLFSYTEDGSKPYMYNIEYSSSDKKRLTVSIMKHMTEEEKIKAEPAPMPVREDKGEVDRKGEINVAEPEKGVALPALPPDAPTQSPSYNPSQASDLPADADIASDTPAVKPEPQDGGKGEGSSGSSASSPGSEPISVDVVNIKVKEIDVTLTVISSAKENGAISSYWVYKDGSYNIYTDGISKDDMVKIIESMVK